METSDFTYPFKTGNPIYMWKGRLLSMTGRVCMIRIVLNSLPLHYMSIFLMLRGIAHVITSIKRRFLWARTFDAKKICKVSWNLVVREKIRGGLRVGSLAGKNKALLFKWIWRLEDQNIRG